MQGSTVAVEETARAAQGARAGAGAARLALLAWALCAACWALLVGTALLLGLSVAAQAAGGPTLPAYVALVSGPNPPALDLIERVCFYVAWAAFATLGARIVARYPTHTIGWIFCALGMFGIGEQFAKFYAIYGLLARPGALPHSLAAAWVTEWTWTIFSGLLCIFLPLLFPTGRLPSARWRPVAWFATASNVLLTLGFAVKPGPLGNVQLLAQFDSPVKIFAPDGLFFTIGPLLFLASLLSMLLAVAALVVRLRRATGDERQQLKWFCYPAALLALLFVAQGLFRYFIGFWPPQLDTGYDLAFALAFLALPIATGIAILKHRLYDIDLVINRTLVYGGLSASVAALYVLVVGSLSALFQARGSLAIALAATALVALLFQPLRDRLQRGVNRLMYGERDDPYAVLSRLGQRLDAALAPDAVLPTFVKTVCEALKLPYAAVALRQDDELVIAAESFGQLASWQAGKAADMLSDGAGAVSVPQLVTLPLAYQNELVGELRLAPRPGEAGFSAADRRLLNDLARQAGIAAYAVRLTAALQRSRERLVAAREEERRRLRRDLHDGLGSTLAGLHLQAGALRAMIGRDPAAADALVVELRDAIRAAIADIRRLAYDLRPPALDELGLVGAIRARATQYAHGHDHAEGALQISVDAPEELPPLPAAVEVAAYRIAQEALANVVHHAHAHTCVVRLALADGLQIEIVDDGAGIAAGRGAGVGLLSMRERATELGGACAIEPAPGGGTCVRAWLPVTSKEQKA